MLCKFKVDEVSQTNTFAQMDYLHLFAWYYYDIRCAILVYNILKILPTCIQTIMVANDNDGDIFLSKDALIEI